MGTRLKYLGTPYFDPKGKMLALALTACSIENLLTFGWGEVGWGGAGLGWAGRVASCCFTRSSPLPRRFDELCDTGCFLFLRTEIL